MTKKISGCIGRPSVGGEIWGPDLPPLKSGLPVERSGSKSQISGAVWAGLKKSSGAWAEQSGRSSKRERSGERDYR